MHLHSEDALAAGPLLHAVVLCLVLSATLFGVRRLVADWHHPRDRVTLATHVGMGTAMTYTLIAPTSVPAVLGAVAMALVTLAFIDRLLTWWLAHLTPRHAQPVVTPGLIMTAVMAVMLTGAERDSNVLQLALLACLLCCAVAYARPLVGTRLLQTPLRAQALRLHEVAIPLALTAGMGAMLPLH